jgi:hemin uptake protein HemP
MDNDKRPTAPPPQATAPERPPAGPPVIASADLLGNAQEVWIHHNGDIYRLQETRAGKLILTK